MDNTKNKFTSNDYSTYAEVLQELGKDSLAIFEYEKAIEVNPDKLDLYKSLSAAYSGAKNYKKALEVFKAFIDKGDYVTNDLVTLANRYQNVAATSEDDSPEKLDAINNAIATLDKVIEKVPGNPIPVRNKARIFLVKNGSSGNGRRLHGSCEIARCRSRKQDQAFRYVQRGFHSDCIILRFRKEYGRG